MVEKYYKGSKLVVLNIALGLGTFIQVLDSSIANVAVPYIAGNLSVSADEGTWVITSFSASNAIVLPLTGWLSDYFGRVKLFVYSVILFSLMSFLCGFSSSLAMLVFFRVLQGAVAGALIPLSQSLLVANSPPEKQGSVLGFWAMVVIVAPVVGPILGGYLTYEYSWPWIFYINIPIGAVSAAITWYLLKDRDTPIVRKPIDWTGLFLLSLGVACLQVMLDKGKDLDWFDSNWIVTLTVVAVVSLAYFIVWNLKSQYPIVDFSFFKDRNFVYGTIMITVGYLMFFGATVITPLWLQTQQGYTSEWAGIAVAPNGLIPILLSVYVGKNLYRFDLRAVVALSFLFFSLSLFYQASFTTQVDLRTIMFTRLIQGFGVVIFFVPLVQLSLGNIPNEKFASASGLNNFIRILVGSGFGTSLTVYFWSRREIFHYNRIGEFITDYNPQVIQFFEQIKQYNPHLTTDVIRGMINQSLEQQSYMLSTNDLIWLFAWLFLLMIPLSFLCKKVDKKKSTKSVAAE